MLKSVLALSGLLGVGLAGLTKSGNRQFLPADIIGDYSRFVQQGNCAADVQLTSFASLTPGAYSVPHGKIKQDGSVCTSAGAFTILTKDAIDRSGNEALLENAPEPISTIVNSLEDQGATFMVGFEQEDRVCGSSTTSGKSIAFFVEEETEIEILGLITLFPGAKYMIVYEPNSPTPCTYYAKYKDSVIGVASGSSTAAPTTSVDEIETISGSYEPEPEYVPYESKEPMDEVNIDPVPVSGVDSTIAEPVTPSPAEEVADSTDSTDTSESSEPATIATVPAGTGASTTSSDDDFGASDVFSFTPEPGPTDEPEDDGSACFPASATVELEDGSVKRMDQVMLGDRVKVGAGEFSPVFMFTHKNADVKYSFVRMTTENGKMLSLTKGHYLYVNGELVAAKTIRVGDSVMTEDGISNVKSVSTVSGTGLFNPQTTNGDIVVNGVLASTYTTTVEARSAHSLLAPVRAMFEWTGMTSSVFEKGADNLAAMMPTGGMVA